MDGQVIEIDDIERKAFGLDPDHAGAIDAGSGNDVEVDTGCEDMAVLVVGVIAADLGPARGGKQVQLGWGCRFTWFWKHVGKFCHQIFQPPGVRGRCIQRATIDFGQASIQPARFQSHKHGFNCFHGAAVSFA